MNVPFILQKIVVVSLICHYFSSGGGVMDLLGEDLSGLQVNISEMNGWVGK